MQKKYLLESTILHFMYLVIDLKRVFQIDYDSLWKEPKYNFYVKKYRIYQAGSKLCIQWINLNNEQKYIMLQKSPYTSVILNKLYSFFHKLILTDDSKRAFNVLTTVIYPDFCKELQISADFTMAKSSREAADLVMCSLYKNFFTSVSIDQFFQMFHLDKKLPTESLKYITENILASNGEVVC